jgi:2-hydroxy-3-oxopropionate reductase
MKVGFIGLGAMGRPMALHLYRAGHDLAVWARRPERIGDLPASICATPAELGHCCEVVFTVITSSADVEAVALGKDGLSEGMVPGSVLVDCSTIAPDVARRIADQLRAKGIHMLDAPVSGGEQGPSMPRWRSWPAEMRRCSRWCGRCSSAWASASCISARMGPGRWPRPVTR